LILWFLLLSIAPLSFMTWYSLSKFENAINEEVEQKVTFNEKEIKSTFTEYYEKLSSKHQNHLKDNSLLFYLTREDNSSLLNLAHKWIQNDNLNKVSIYNRDGLLLFTSYNMGQGKVNDIVNLGDEPVYVSKDFMESFGTKKQTFVIDIEKNQQLDFVAFSRIENASGATVGYLQEALRADKKLIKDISESLGGTNIIVYKDGDKERLVSHSNLFKFNVNNWEVKKEVKLKEQELSFSKFKLDWADDWVNVVLGQSKKSYQAVLKNVITSFVTMMIGITVVLIILSFIISLVLLKPLNRLLDVLKSKDPGEELVELPIETNTELGVLTKKFNELFAKVFNSQKQLKTNIVKLEDVNTEIKGDQTKLVHNEKMASLGQLVAGVAHELNNPIGFIYSNMGHLRDYATNLVRIIEEGDGNKEQVEKLKEELDYDFMVRDLPKLIQSCEDGAKRTRDIVLGLRNFSRIEEAKLKEVDITEGIDRTLDLLKGELKSKVTVVKKYGKAPLINCYPSQLNQVFMNIIANSIHAIEDRGELTIQTKIIENKLIELSFKDTGKGIDEETMAKVFDPFFTTKDIGKGTGLGLSISYGIIQKHEGEIKVNSKVGEGTEFIITLPITGPKNSEEPKS